MLNVKWPPPPREQLIFVYTLTQLTQTRDFFKPPVPLYEYHSIIEKEREKKERGDRGIEMGKKGK
jgi:hypothetical protein